MGMTGSVLANRVTIWLTERQREYVFAGMRRCGIGLSEFVRRKFDEIIDAEEEPEIPREPLDRK